MHLKITTFNTALTTSLPVSFIRFIIDTDAVMWGSKIWSSDKYPFENNEIVDFEVRDVQLSGPVSIPVFR